MADITTDHDAIVTLVAEMKQLRQEIRELKDDVKDVKENVTNRVDALEHEKIDRRELTELKTHYDGKHKDHEARLRRLERYGAIAIGALAVIQFVLNYVK